jgi:Nucleotidyl transferase AbiEii toxin, Type IV TA system
VATVSSKTRRAAQFARLHVDSADGLHLDLDLGVDWRQDDPVTLEVGPVLSLSDVVGNKVSALYSRGEPRDYLDVDAIRASGRFSDDQLIAAAAERDAGFEVEMFAQQLADVRRITLADVYRYGVSADQLEGIKERCTQWATDLRDQLTND